MARPPVSPCWLRAVSQAQRLSSVLLCSTYCHYAEANGVHALLAGEVFEWPGVDMVAANHDGGPRPLASIRSGGRMF